jgi:hypothetical protein
MPLGAGYRFVGRRDQRKCWIETPGERRGLNGWEMGGERHFIHGVVNRYGHGLHWYLVGQDSQIHGCSVYNISQFSTQNAH